MSEELKLQAFYNEFCGGDCTGEMAESGPCQYMIDSSCQHHKHPDNIKLAREYKPKSNLRAKTV